MSARQSDTFTMRVTQVTHVDRHVPADTVHFRGLHHGIPHTNAHQKKDRHDLKEKGR
jgi:hypothetical protein